MKHKKKKGNIKFYAAIFIIVGVIGFLLTKDQLKVTVVNSFSEAYADNLNYHELSSADKSIVSFKELAVEGKKTFIFVSSNWCSICDAVALKLREKSVENPDYIVYEADIDEFRTQLNEFKISNTPKLILVNKDSYKIIENVRYDNLEQLLATEI